VAQVDKWGLLLGVLLHCVGAVNASSRASWRAHLLIFACAVALQLLQLLWLFSARDSYSRCRTAINVAQRLRWLLVKFIIIRDIPSMEYLVRKHSVGGIPPGMRALAHGSLVSPLLLLLNTMNHTLPFRCVCGGHAVHASCSYLCAACARSPAAGAPAAAAGSPSARPYPRPRRLQCLLVLASFGMEAGGGLQIQMRTIRAGALEPLARRVCYMTTQLALAPLTLDDSLPFCEDRAIAFAVVFALLLAGTGALLLTYRQERAAKLRHMQELLYMRELLGAAGASAGEGRPGAALEEGGAVLVALVHGWATAVVACVVAMAWAEVVDWR
jgi:hypothetical protein